MEGRCYVRVGLPGLHQEAFDLRGIVASSMEGLVAVSALAAGFVGDRPRRPQQDPAWLLALAARER